MGAVSSRIKKTAALLPIILLMPLSLTRAGEVTTSAGTLRLDPLIKVLFTYRPEHEDTGVEDIQEAELRWAGIRLHGLAGPASCEIEALVSNTTYLDPLRDEEEPGLEDRTAQAARIRRASITLTPMPLVSIKAGTFFPSWGMLHKRPASRWRFIDLPLLYTHQSMADLGRQNTGIEIKLSPLPWATIDAFAINGYLPEYSAFSDVILPSGARDYNKGFGGRATLNAGPASVFGGYYAERFEKTISSDQSLGEKRAWSWIAGAEISSPPLWGAFEWTGLWVEGRELKKDGAWEEGRSFSAWAAAGWRFTKKWEALVRWEWIEPNAADTDETVFQSRFDQVTRWTAGLNYRLSDMSLVMLNYVVPVEQGQRVDVSRSKTGGPFQQRVNNYLMLQFQAGK